MPKPRLSVVTVTFNPGDKFRQTLSSVREQSARNVVEYLVVDGSSSDGTVEALRTAGERGEVDRWISEPDQGLYDAMNKAVAMAQGEYVLFLNAGDLFSSASTVEQFLNFSGQPGLVWGDCEIAMADRLVLDPAGRMLRYLYRQMTVSHQSLAVRTDLLRSHPFDLTLKVCADYEVLCALVSEGESSVYRPLTVARIEEEGFSSRNFFLGLEEKRQISRRYFPRDRWRSEPYFALWGLYMRIKNWYKERP